MIGQGSNRNALRRTYLLCESDPEMQHCGIIAEKSIAYNKPKQGLAKVLWQAELPISAPVFLLTISIFSVGSAAMAAPFVNEFLLPLIAAGVASMPFGWIDSRIQSKSSRFSEDYPTLLLAAASSIKAGHTVECAMERAIQLMPKTSVVREEVEKLLEATGKGVSKEEAIARFAARIRLPDIELFRAAYLLAANNGGRFAPTLERLAKVTRDRICLLGAAKVSTSTMRMTSNVLLVIAPIILMIVSLRSASFWETLLNDSVANTAATVGVTCIVGGYLWVRRLSAFKP
ncbi:MAG: type II secretion system F family protein [Bdellovibrionales bacterium]|nr:type II secretion system F family protein [Bdellovibrionales bacterium]